VVDAQNKLSDRFTDEQKERGGAPIREPDDLAQSVQDVRSGLSDYIYTELIGRGRSANSPSLQTKRDHFATGGPFFDVAAPIRCLFPAGTTTATQSMGSFGKSKDLVTGSGSIVRTNPAGDTRAQVFGPSSRAE
jgi:hypothetical protein